MSDTSSDDILDGLVEDVEENLNESDADEEVDVDEDILEALEGGLAEQASDADDVCLTALFKPLADFEQLSRILTMTLTIQTTIRSLKPPRA